MSFTFQMEPQLLVALTDCCLANCSHNPFIDGVRFEVSRDKILVIATTGVIMGVAKVDHDQETSPFNFTIPRELIIKAVSVKTITPVTVTIADKNVSLKQSDQVILNFNISDAPFSQWRNALPLKFTNKASQYDPKLMATIQKIATKLKTAMVYITPNGKDPGFVDFGRDDFFGLIMPLKPQITETLPSWVLQKTAITNQ